ncbi:hypothetical protein CTAYLR_003657 [Chrysophaeum taylorii]|uniref:Uncharacterized protein n=1 Tax=Chrysophaeum taylorii TaxID=2483200 RepID=A0AAD7UC46_9STRA|nr:hypothetical protein CTAYLR_003657 [Chrysophaeum taylorii]
MGFNVSDVLSDESHYSEFLCVFCRDLADDAHILPCSHVFCRFCLQQWVIQAAKHGDPAEVPTCPSCRQQRISNEADILPLADANPLAARILGRVRCRCPLWAQGCTWRGDYSEVHAHLTNSEEHLGCGGQAATIAGSGGGVYEEKGARDVEMTDAQSVARRKNAEALKAQADTKYSARAYAQAAALYAKAIDLAPDVASYWANRAACAFMERRYGACVDDCERALALDSMLTKAARRKARAQVELSKFDCAAAGLAVALAKAPSESEMPVIVQEARSIAALSQETNLGMRAVRRGDFKAATAAFGRALKTTTAIVVVLGAAVADLGLGRIERALRLTMQALTRNDGAAFRSLACAIRGATLVLQDDGDVETGFALLREALRLDPDDDDAKTALRAAKRCKRDRDLAKSFAHKRDFQAAVEAYGTVLDELGDTRGPRQQPGADADPRQQQYEGAAEIPEPERSTCPRLLPPLSVLAAATPLVAQVRAERANCYLRLGDHAASLRDCAVALYVKDDCIDAHLTRAAALRATGRHDHALADLGALMDRWGHNDVRVRHAYETTAFEARKAKRPDYYVVLGCRKVSTEKEIKAAYYRKSREHHVDRHVQADDATRAEHEAAFKVVGEAFEVLADPSKRALYDEGYDLRAIEERLAAAERATREHAYRSRHHPSR